MKISKKEINLLFMILLVIAIAVSYQYVYVGISEKKDQTQKEKETNETALQEQKQKAENLETLKSELAQTQSDYENRTLNFYGPVPQEAFLFLLHDWRVKTGLEFTEVEFKPIEAIPMEQIEVSSTKIAESIKNKTVLDMTQDYTSQEDLIPKETDISKYAVTLKLKGKYFQLKRLLNMIDHNEKEIVVSKLSYKMENEKLSLPGTAEEDINVLGVSSAEVADLVSEINTTRELSNDGQLEIELDLQFYTLPSIAGNDEKKQEKEVWEWRWEWKKSLEDAMPYLNFLAKTRTKQKVHEFDGTEYKLLESGVGTISKDGEKNIIILDYEFKKGSKNPKVTVDLKDKNVTIDLKDKNNKVVDKISGIGISMSSKEIIDNKVVLKLQDANNKIIEISLTDKIYWSGWATISQNIETEVAYPLKVQSIEISKKVEKLAEDMKNTVEFDFIFSNTIKK